ncbi:MAG: FCD domain-containing protein [Chrysiogenales bacterium]|nr:MAG: FCD domain-containing protein [Chrysiogenales bacterium]
MRVKRRRWGPKDETIDALVARKATELGTEEDRKLISGSIEECREAAYRGDPSVYFKAIIRYEDCSLKAARNHVLFRLLRDLWPPSHRVQYATLHLRSESLVDHFRFFETAHQVLLQRDMTGASAAVRDLTESEVAFGVRYLPRFNDL